MSGVRIKSCNVTNKENVIVQIPKWVVELWHLQNGDKLHMEMNEDCTVLLIKKQQEEE